MQGVSNVLYGGDYNPEQWDRETWREDMRLFQKAGVNFVRIHIFAWALSQPDEVTYRFEWLDEVFDMLHHNGIKVGLGTGTAAHPAWMARKYPDILRVEFDGQKRKFGARHNSCPNSPAYHRFARRFVQRLVEWYRDHPALLLWNVSNEFGGACYCEQCEKQFRVWLKQRYATLDRLNRVWNTSFWGHTFYDWDDIVVPNRLSEHGSEMQTAFPNISLDYARFMSDSLLACYRLEYDEIKKESPDALVTTNLMGEYKPLDYFKWASHMDVVAWDSYPSIDTPVSRTAMRHDLMRGLKKGAPWMLMEQTPSQTNWQPYNALKRPGVMRLLSYQAVARGADTVLFFQMRRSVSACEKFHGALIEHAGHEHTRVFRECAALGDELKGLSELLGSRVVSRVAIVFDWENWWAVEYSSGPSIALRYADEVHKYYQALHQQNIAVEIIGVDTDLQTYNIVIAPVLYMVKQGYAERIDAYVQQGGTFVTTFFSGIVDEQDRVTLGGYPGELRKTLGIWVEEIDALPPDRQNEIVLSEKPGTLSETYTCHLLYDLLHTEGAEVFAEYGKDFYRGRPVVTVHRRGKGEAWYVASSPERAFLEDWLRLLCEKKGIAPVLSAPEGVEVVERKKGNTAYIFVLNHNEETKQVLVGTEPIKEMLSDRTVRDEFSVSAKGVAILKKK